MKRHEVLAAIAAAAGLAFAVPAQAGIASSTSLTGKPVIETLAELQQQVGESDDALSKMIHLAKSEGKGGNSGKGQGGGASNGKSSGKGKSDAAKGSDRGKSEGKGHVSQGKGKGHDSHGKGKGKGHGKGHTHPS
jgi:hypothetical protein